MRSGLVIAIVVAVVVAVVAAPAHASGGRSMGMYPTQAPSMALPMVDSRIDVTVRGPIIETLVTQRFTNRADRPIEATYIFPLPVDAAVSAMWIQTGDRTIRAAIEPRAEAQRRYEAAVRAGVGAAVLDQERADVFTQTIAAIPARGTIEVTLRYDTVARYAAGTWSLVLPMVVGPRYVPGAVSGRPTTGTGRLPDTDRAPDASRVTPTTSPQGGGTTAVTVRFVEPVVDVTSATHPLTTSTVGATVVASFVDPRSDHDAIVQWRTRRTAAGWVEQGPGGGFAAVVVEGPPARPRQGMLRLLIVLDRAATMKGDAWLVARPLLHELLGGMLAADRVAVTGSDRLGWSSPADAQRAIDAGTRRGPFDLTRVLQAARPDGAPMLLISDGLVADDRAAIVAAKKLGVPIHVIGVGPAPARGLLTQLAAATGGTIRFVVPIDEPASIARAVIGDVASPPPPITVTWGTLVASEVVPATLPRLGAGQAMLVLARVKQAQAANARVRGELFAFEAVAPAPTIAGAVTPSGSLARRWARAKLDELLVGNPDPRAVTRHALAFGLVSPYTSLVAIGDRVVVEGGVKHSVSVPVAVPAGMQWGDVERETAVDTGGAQLDATKLDDARKQQAPVVRQTPNRNAPAGGERAGVADATGADAEAMPTDAPEPAPMSPTSGSVASMDEDDDGELDVVLAESRSYRRAWRIVAGLGGGVAIEDQATAPVLALGLRLEAGRRVRIGAEATLWLVDGVHGQSRTMFTFARRGIARWFEVGGGLGLHVTGRALGPAASLTLRTVVPPVPALAGYLRYDAALLREDGGARHGQSTLTLGVEWGF